MVQKDKSKRNECHKKYSFYSQVGKALSKKSTNGINTEACLLNRTAIIKYDSIAQTTRKVLWDTYRQEINVKHCMKSSWM